MSVEAVLPDMFTSVAVVDRAMLGGCEIVYNGVRLVFAPGEIKKALPRGVVEHVFQTQKELVPLKGGGFAMRFGVENPSEELIQVLGPECGDCNPIEIDPARLERWDVENHVQNGGGTRKVLTVSRDPSDFQNVAGGASTFGLER